MEFDHVKASLICPESSLAEIANYPVPIPCIHGTSPGFDLTYEVACEVEALFKRE